MSVFGGDQWRPLLHVNDVENAIDVTIETKVNGIFNLHYQNFKIIEIAEEIEKKNNYSGNYQNTIGVPRCKKLSSNK